MYLHQGIRSNRRRIQFLHSKRRRREEKAKSPHMQWHAANGGKPSPGPSDVPRLVPRTCHGRCSCEEEENEDDSVGVPDLYKPQSSDEEDDQSSDEEDDEGDGVWRQQHARASLTQQEKQQHLARM